MEKIFNKSKIFSTTLSSLKVNKRNFLSYFSTVSTGTTTTKFFYFYIFLY